MSDVVLYEAADGIATVTINRPEVRNAINTAVRDGLWTRFGEADQDPTVDVVIVTGADPAFCAGLDLKELATRPAEPASGEASREPTINRFVPFMTKPVIAAVNGVCVTGGLELALQCSFIVCSDRARFADTHARVGVMPGGGMTVLLPQAVGVRKAREMSLTGNYIDGDEAARLGLANHVVPHDELLPFTRGLAADIASLDAVFARHLLATYDVTSGTTVVEGLRHEALAARQLRIDGAEIERRRTAVIERGRDQVTPT